MMFGGIFLTILLIVGIIYFARYFTDEGLLNFGGEHKTAMQILKERYARGEINREQFESMKKDLE